MRKSSAFCKVDIQFAGIDAMEIIHKKTFHRNQRLPQGEIWHPNATAIPVDMYEVAGNRAKELLFNQLPYELLKHQPDVCVFEVVAPWHSILPVVACHRDYGRTSALNCFYDVNGDPFIFPDEPSWFVPRDKDSYILDVTKPHFVGLQPGSVLRILSFSFQKLSYEDLWRGCASYIRERDRSCC